MNSRDQVNLDMLLDKTSAENPYSPPAKAPQRERRLSARVRFRYTTLAIVALACLLIPTIALIDAAREGYYEPVGFGFIALVAFLPGAIGFKAMLATRHRSSGVFLVWVVGTLIVILPGLVVWTICALQPVPRMHLGAGQMHIFFFPVLHLVGSVVVYLGTGWVHGLFVLAHQNQQDDALHTKPRSQSV